VLPVFRPASSRPSHLSCPNTVHDPVHGVIERNHFLRIFKKIDLKASPYKSRKSDTYQPDPHPSVIKLIKKIHYTSGKRVVGRSKRNSALPGLGIEVRVTDLKYYGRCKPLFTA